MDGTDSPPSPPGSPSADLMLQSATVDTASEKPTKTRVMNSVPPPASKAISSTDLWTTSSARILPKGTNPSIYSHLPVPNLEKLKDHLLREGKLEKHDFIKLVKATSAILKMEPNIVDIPLPITICGDIHGQFYDLVNLFNIGGQLSLDNPYLFLGDYVDRAMFSCECVTYLFALKLCFPKSLTLLRGNHESRLLTADFSFKLEATRKYDLEVYDTIMSSFDCLPLASIVNGSFLCVHGGISPEMKTLDDLRKINRFQEIPALGIMADILWSDPHPDYDTSQIDHFIPNQPRQCSYHYPYKVTTRFLQKNNLLCLIRAHEVQQEGYRMYKTWGPDNFPTVISLFSAPRYHDMWTNKGAVLKYSKNKIDVLHFDAVPHPFVLPKFQDVFTWSLPFVANQVADIFVQILQLLGFSDEMSDEDDEEEATKAAYAALNLQLERAAAKKRANAIRSKIQAVARYRSMFSTLREEHETIEQIRKYSPSGSLPRGLLLDGPSALTDALGTFEKRQTKARSAAASWDHEKCFERRPEYAAGTPPAEAIARAAQKAQNDAKNGIYPTLDYDDIEEFAAAAAAAATLPNKPAPHVTIAKSSLSSLSLGFGSTTTQPATTSSEAIPLSTTSTATTTSKSKAKSSKKTPPSNGKTPKKPKTPDQDNSKNNMAYVTM